jgi:serpin B
VRALIVALSFALAGCGGSGPAPPDDPGPPPPPWSDDMQAVADGANRFALDLYGKLREEEKGNLFFSPYSIHAALAMTADGAAGATRDQMVKVLHLPPDREKSLAAGDLGRYYAAGGRPYELSVGNALWGQKGFPWRQDFLDRQRQRFGAGFNEADFASNPEAERLRINRWVEEKTKDRIKELLKPNDLDELTRMVLANAIYFKGKWAEPFKPHATQDGPFHTADGKQSKVPFMNRTGKYRHADLSDFQALEMPYQGGDLSMVVLLPRKFDGLPTVEDRLTADALAGWLGQLSQDEVAVQFPRFKLELRFEPHERLKQLGMTDPFEPDKADFTGMADLGGSVPLYVSKVIHKAYVDVNEEGTEAAAATAVVAATPMAAPRKPIEFRADRPFLFLIRDVRHGTILFLGRLTDPPR